MIDLAKCMLMVLYGLTADQVFEVSKWRSQNDNVKLRVIAEQLCAELPALARDRIEAPRSGCDTVLTIPHDTMGPRSKAVANTMC